MADVMISYARADRPAADLLARCLTADGFNVWFDREIPPGQTFDEVIDRALREARKVVVLWSRQSVGSRWVVAEAEEAASMAKLIPARLDDSVIPLEFRRVQAADLIGWSGDPQAAGFRALLATLRSEGQLDVPAQTAHRPAAAAPPTRRHHSGRWLVGLLLVAALAVVLWLLPDGPTPGPGASSTAIPATVSQHGDRTGPEPELTAPQAELTAPQSELLDAALLSAPFDTVIEKTGASPKDVADLVIQQWIESADCGGASEGRVVSLTEGEPALAVVDVALPCMDNADAFFPYSGGLRLQLTIADEAGTWTVTKTMAQVYCPHGVESGALCRSDTP